MTYFLTVPGLGNSGPDHWQTFFENSEGNFRRVVQAEWNAPDCRDWIVTIDKSVLSLHPDSVVLIGHSLGCAAIAFWAQRLKRVIKGALLVAPSDTEAPGYTFPTTGFTPMPIDERIGFKTIVVASANDPWVSIERAKCFADKWGSEFIDIGNAGHINASSGHGPWKEGLDILKRLDT